LVSDQYTRGLVIILPTATTLKIPGVRWSMARWTTKLHLSAGLLYGDLHDSGSGN